MNMKQIIVFSTLIVAIVFATILVFPIIVECEKTRILVQENMRTEFSEYLNGVSERSVYIEKISENTFYVFTLDLSKDIINKVISNFGKRHKIISVSVQYIPNNRSYHAYIAVEDLDNKNVEQ